MPRQSIANLRYLEVPVFGITCCRIRTSVTRVTGVFLSSSSGSFELEAACAALHVAWSASKDFMLEVLRKQELQ